MFTEPYSDIVTNNGPQGRKSNAIILSKTNGKKTILM